MKRRIRKINSKKNLRLRYQTKVYNAQFDTKFLDISIVTNPLVPIGVIKEIKEEDIKKPKEKIYTLGVETF